MQKWIVRYDYQPDRKACRSKNFLEGFRGYLHTDYSDKKAISIFLGFLRKINASLLEYKRRAVKPFGIPARRFDI